VFKPAKEWSSSKEGRFFQRKTRRAWLGTGVPTRHSPPTKKVSEPSRLQRVLTSGQAGPLRARANRENISPEAICRRADGGDQRGRTAAGTHLKWKLNLKVNRCLEEGLIQSPIPHVGHPPFFNQQREVRAKHYGRTSHQTQRHGDHMLQIRPGPDSRSECIGNERRSKKGDVHRLRYRFIRTNL